jgi:protein tyrosine/serine phosphatase
MTLTSRFAATTLALVALGAALSPFASANEPPPRHAAEAMAWAVPVDPSFNLFRITPSLYRSALPEAGDLPQLERLKVKTVISFIKDDDTDWIGSAPIDTVSIPLHADRVDDEDVLQVLRVMQAAEARGPVLIHCKHGRDRTGLMAAMYRTVVQGWSKEQALAEMQSGGFGDADQMEDAVAYVERADVPALRQAMASGACSTSAFATCQAMGWLSRALASDDEPGE